MIIAVPTGIKVFKLVGNSLGWFKYLSKHHYYLHLDLILLFTLGGLTGINFI
jgi:heme/copper-type cytochrome/quinol oxidase subunit 1